MNDLVLKYAALVGKFIDARRPADEVEILDAQAAGDSLTELMEVGGMGLVVKVCDGGQRLGGPSVDVVFDYGMGVLILAEDEADWRIDIYASEKDAYHFLGASRRPSRFSKHLVDRVTEALDDPLTMLGVNTKETYEGDGRTCGQILAEIAIGAGL